MPAIKAAKASAAEPTNLMPGIHPAFLLAMTDEVTPEDWLMAKQGNPRMFAWHFAIYQSAAGIGREIPEYVLGYSTQKATFGGKRMSKLYEWTTTLIGRN